MSLRRLAKRLGLGLAALLLALLLIFALFLGYSQIYSFQPEALEVLEIQGQTGPRLKVGTQLNLLSYNLGYAGLGEEEDFFMDGGTMVQPSRERVERNFQGLLQELKREAGDLVFLQEVDRNSQRSYGRDQVAALEAEIGGQGTFAYNFLVPYVPYPLQQPIGKVASGLLTVSQYEMAEAQRLDLPGSFSWPVSLFNLRRCLLLSRLPIEGTNQSLVLVNLHLEAYDEGAGKQAQTRVLREVLEREYAAGNYVVAGGDWNQMFFASEGEPPVYPPQENRDWMPGQLRAGDIPEGWQLVFDHERPSCRLNNQAYKGHEATTPTFAIDGFLLSPNLQVEGFETVETGFRYSDHQPVRLRFRLR